jgi:hypothetical protein
VLAILAMLALKSALRVAPGGSAPPIPSVALRGSNIVRSGRESRFCQSNWKAGKRPQNDLTGKTPYKQLRYFFFYLGFTGNAAR